MPTGTPPATQLALLGRQLKKGLKSAGEVTELTVIQFELELLSRLPPLIPVAFQPEFKGWPVTIGSRSTSSGDRKGRSDNSTCTAG